MQFHQLVIDPLLTAPLTTHFRPVLVDWDVRRAPLRAARVAGTLITTHYLTRWATHPSVTTLYIVSDLLFEDWVITAHNPNGVTIEDILTALHRGLQVPLTQPEWEGMSSTQRTRIQDTFYARCEASRDFDRTRHGGVRRLDCLLHTTVFAGLSSLMYRNSRWEVVLTLSRDFGAHARARSQRDA
ncbi:hypothetical protein JVU11DRAFT_5780 [Chiua virens]|nr:hypothetical protein JVU11DRAFT_5780 [Chiua virens]